MEHNYVTLLDHDVAITMHADKIDILTLQCRRSEKDFYLRKDKKYIKRVQDTIILLKNEAQQVVDMSGRESEMGTLGSLIMQNIDIYQDKFLAVAQAWETTGLDHKSGLQGEFRTSARDLAEDLKEHQMSDLNMAFLQMRRYEKDFHRVRSAKYKKKWLAAIKTFNDLIITRRLDPEVKEILTREISKYQKDTHSFIQFDTSEGYESIRNTAKTWRTRSIPYTSIKPKPCFSIFVNTRRITSFVVIQSMSTRRWKPLKICVRVLIMTRWQRSTYSPSVCRLMRTKILS